MTKWECIRQISQQGTLFKTDAILRLLEWCNKPNTSSVTTEEAQEFLNMLFAEEQALSCGQRPQFLGERK